MKTSILILSIFVLGGCGGSSGSLGSGGMTGGGGVNGSGGGLTGSGGRVGSGGAGGNSCSEASPCVGSICTGTKQGCSGAWTCTKASSACSADLASYCGCDGMTFQDSSSCPTRPYFFAGPCQLGVSCDIRQVICAAAPPVCPAGETVSVDGICWGPCVPIHYCRCTLDSDCPSGHTCRPSAGLCI